MEWTKEALNRTAIQIKNMAHGKRILKFYKSYGFDTNGFLSSIPSVKNRYYCVAYGKVLYGTNPIGFEIIKLPTKPRRKFPREMMISNDKENWQSFPVEGKFKRKFLVYVGWGEYKAWEYAKEID